MPDRLRRLRKTPALRRLFQETRIDPSMFVYPLFVSETASNPEPIPSMPGQFRWPLAEINQPLDQALHAGVGGLLLFGIPLHKDKIGSGAYDPKGIVAKSLQSLRHQAKHLVLVADVCLCEYTDHGHCGVIGGQEVDNDRTLELLTKTGVCYAQAGADIVAPSSMMDYQVGAIRRGLDESGLVDTAVMGYSAKFASGFYGPFRDAAGSAPSFGDRKSYQHDFANGRHAILEVQADIEEGADIVMVKPGLPYLDIVAQTRAITDLPVAVYNVSGEYAMIKSAAQNGWLDEKSVTLETLYAFARSGADLIITYHAIEASKWLKET